MRHSIVAEDNDTIVLCISRLSVLTNYSQDMIEEVTKICMDREEHFKERSEFHIRANSEMMD